MSATLVSDWKFMEVDRAELELKTVLACGQSFRWKLIKEEPYLEVWTGVFNHSVWKLRQEDQGIYYKVFPKVSELQSVDFHLQLQNYFQLKVPLVKLYDDWATRDQRFALLPLTQCRGIRILKQDPIETIFAFICSSNNQIQRITKMVETLCRLYGEKICNINSESYFDFPMLESLQDKDVETQLRINGFGYRAGYISKSAALILSKGGDTWINGLKSMGYGKARNELQSLVGVGRKVADCVCLMGLEYHEAIPVDTHILKAGQEYLPHLRGRKGLTDKTYTEITEHFRELHGEYAGWAQSVLFSSKLRAFEDWFDTNKKKKERKRKKEDSK